MPAPQVSIRIMENAFDPEAEAAVFRKDNPAAGAIVTFLGQAREDGGVDRLVLEHYAGFTQKMIENITTEALDRWPLHAISILHRVGELAPQAPIVFVATAAAHRRPAFEAADFLMDYLKSEAPFWKQEIANGAARWVEPRAQDHEDKARWAAPDKGK